MSIEDKFRAAVQVIKSLPTDGPYQPSNETKLKFYSLYKQATEGKCHQARPSFWDIIGKAKWDAWNKLGDMDKTDAMNAYIDELKKIVETMSFNGDVQNFLDSIGPFYEFITLNSPELDDVKETIDRLTSSSGSTASDTPGSLSNHNSYPSSAVTSEQNTPAKSIQESEVVPNGGTNYYKLNGDIKQGSVMNGHIQNSYEEDNNDDLPNLIPPPAPVHRASFSGPATSEPLSSGFEDDNEVMEIHADGSVDVRAGQGSRTSESERFYSGDSDDEYDGVSFPNGNLVPLEPVAHSSKSIPWESEQRQGQGSGGIRKSRKHRSDRVEFNMDAQNDCPTCSATARAVESTAVLNMTVERLNRDIEHVLARLRILETAYASSQALGNASGSGTDLPNSKTRRPKPFQELSKTTWIIIFSWPIAVHLIFKLIAWYVNRRRSRPPQRPAIGF